MPSVRIRIWIGLAVLTLLGFAWAFSPRAVEIDASYVTRDDMTVTVSDDGMTRVRDVFVLSAPLDGTMSRVDVEPGDQVQVGETVISTIRPLLPPLLPARTTAQLESNVSSAEAALTAARADAERLRAEHNRLKRDLDRAKKLLVSATISQQAVDNAEAAEREGYLALRSSEAVIGVRRQQLAAARAALMPSETQNGSDTVTIIAPLSGQILAVDRESEGPIAQGTPIVEIGDLNSLECVADFLSEEAVRVKPGDPVMFTDWGGPPLPGRVRRVEPAGFTKVSALGIEEQRVNIIMDLNDPSARQNLGHGYRFVANIAVWEGTNRLVVPMSALFRDADGWAVFVVSKGRAEWRSVSVGHTNRTYAEILGGLTEGTRVVVHPPRQLERGAKVKIRTAPKANRAIDSAVTTSG
ncbi:efflux RND transporter periplasmic adaptor subunit [Hyphomonas adhaerens]|uniref:efflux RND transporter periplasmic adaptor subunit n=1 Tax=Hyphomonas adhaerens TaxID=81029 RepID=UPI000A05E209|nr:efflux RND transporter periplasmic adaptor subunit [Hyphomonas adhaerens]